MVHVLMRSEFKMEHVILVAFQVAADSREDAHRHLGDALAPLLRSNDNTEVEAWWVAEDDRQDGSDNDSAVFVTPGNQQAASEWLYLKGYTPHCNLVKPQVNGQFEVEER